MNLPGKYLLVIETQGFKKQEFQDVVVNAGQDATIDAVLQAGLATETITVTAEGQELIQKEQVQISSTFESRKVAELPTNIAGGGIDALALLAPGVVPGFGNVNNNGTTLSVNGNRARSNNFSVDGQDNNDLSIGGPNFFVDNQDIVAEFQVITNNFSAEYGRNQGAIVNIVTKAGTNDYHGTAFWFHRDRNNWDSRTNIEKRGGQEDPEPFLYNVYGGTFGGPIKKDSLFFFGSYQLVTGRNEGISRSGNPTIAPEELGRFKSAFPNNPLLQTLADFSAFAITDVGTLSERTDRPNNETVTIGGQTFRLAYPQRAIKSPFNQDEFSIRGDWRINDRHSFWYRHLYQTADNKNALQSPGSGGFISDIPVTSQLGGAQFTSQISNTAVNEFRFVFNRLDVIFGGGCEGSKGCIPDPRDIGDTFTNIQFAGLRSSLTNSAVQSIGPATNLPQGRIVSIYQFADNFSKTLGRHQLKMGADIRRLTNSVPFLPNVNGVFRFNTPASVTNAISSNFTLASGTVDLQYTETDQFYYFQDDWRIKDNLTLNLGVRYEYTGQPINRLNEVSVQTESNPATALWRQSIPIEDRTYPKLDADSNNWAPRLGFAWRPRLSDNAIGRWMFGEQDQTVISGGYSIAYDPAFYNIMLNISTSSPLVFLDTVVPNFQIPLNPTGATIQQLGQSSGLLRKDTFDPKFLSRTQVAPDFYSPYSQQWSLRVQREISRNNVVEVRYVGTRGTGLFQTLNRNPRVANLVNGFSANVAGLGVVNFPSFANLLPPGTTPLICVNDPATPDNESVCNGRISDGGVLRSRENTATSIYHGLQTRWQANLFNQLNLGMSHTLSKALDNASEIFSFFEASGAQNPLDVNRGERGFSGFDRRQAYSLNFIWDVPGFKSQEGVLGRILGGWQLNGTYFLADGQRFTPAQFANFAFLGGGGSYQDGTWEATFLGLDTFRPFNGNPNAPGTAVGISQIDAVLLNPALFGIAGLSVSDPGGFFSFNDLNNGKVTTVTRDQVRYIFNGPGAATIFGSPFGDVTRGQEVGPRLNQLNLGIFKNIKVKENVRIQVRGEFFNALNHPSPGVGVVGGGRTPDQFVEDAGTPDGFLDFTGIGFSRRVVQLGMRIIF